MFGQNKKTNDNKKTHESAKTVIEDFFDGFDDEFGSTLKMIDDFRGIETPEGAARILRDLQQTMRAYMNRVLIFNQNLEYFARDFERSKR